MKNVKKVLLEMGIPPHLSGFRYIEECIKVMDETGNTVCDHICADVYEEVARRHGTTYSCVERSIRHAVEYAFNYADPEYIQELFGRCISSFRGKATNKQFLSVLYLIVTEQI